MSDKNFRDFIHQKILAHRAEAERWFQQKAQGRPMPLYAGFDIRDSGFKSACVDANVFPAGFNNICEEDQKRAEELMKNYLKAKRPKARHILLLAEEHSRNLYYWDNIFIIKTLIERTGREVSVCVPGQNMKAPQRLVSAGGREIHIQLLKEAKGDLIIANNDFSLPYDLPQGLICDPPRGMGWFARRKHNFFKHYNRLAEEFSALLNIEAGFLTVATELFSPFDMESAENLKQLKTRAKGLLQSLKSKLPAGAKEAPYLFLKNNSGTYGLGVMNLDDPESLNRWTYKARKKMKAGKDRKTVSEIIIQEGIATAVSDPEGQSAEPVIYTIGGQVAGGFLRSHKSKDRKTNLNSPGAVFKRFCMSDLEIKVQGMAMENVYSWIAKLGLLALSQEMGHL